MEGRVTVTRLEGAHVDAVVRGDHGVYRLEHRDGRWTCACPFPFDLCSHLMAVQSVTAPAGGWILAPDQMVSVGGGAER
jgi:hypothetical protein